MPQVPISEGNRVRLAPLASERIRPADMRGVGAGIGAGLQRVGDAGAQFAQTKDQIAEIRAEEEARRLDIEHMEFARVQRSQVRQSRGINAREASGTAEEKLREFNSGLLGRASLRARRHLERTVATRTAQELDSWQGHALGEEGKAIEAGFEARASKFAEAALDHAEEPEILAANIAAGAQEIERRGQLAGWDPAQTESTKNEYLSRIHVGHARQRFMADNVDGALAILDDNRGVIAESDDIQLRGLITGELNLQQADADAAFVVAGAAAVAEVPPGETAFQPPVRNSITVRGGEYGAPRSYGGHVGRDYAAPAGTPVYPMADGTVERVFRSEGGGNTVEIEMAGGWKMRVLHLQDGSTRHLREGQRVGVNDIVGGVGDTGTASRGNHAHVEVINPQGERVNPSSVMGKPAGTPAPDGRRVDIAAAYARIDAQPWSEARKRRAREAAQQFASQNDVVRGRIEQDADRAIGRRLVEIQKGGGKLTSMTQLDPGALAQASPNTILQLQSQIEANNKPEPIPAHGQTALTLNLQSIVEPERFKTTDLRLYQHELTPAEYARLALDQAKMRTERAGSPTANLRSEIAGTINFYGRDIGWSDSGGFNDDKKVDATERARYLTIFNMMQGHVERLTGGKRAPTDQELKAAFDRATVQVVQSERGLFGSRAVERRAYEVEGDKPAEVSVPLPIVNRITSIFRQAYGRDPTRREVQIEYLSRMGVKGYW